MNRLAITHVDLTEKLNKKHLVYIMLDEKREFVDFQVFDEEESIDLEEYTIEELKDMIFKGEIRDSKTVAGLLAYALHC